MKTIKQAAEICGVTKKILYHRLKRINEFNQIDPENNEPRYIARESGPGSPVRYLTDMTVEKVKNLPPLKGGRPKKVGA